MSKSIKNTKTTITFKADTRTLLVLARIHDKIQANNTNNPITYDELLINLIDEKAKTLNVPLGLS